MESKHTISDELLAKYLSGATTPEETEEVLSYLAENDGNIEDLGNIAMAIEVQHNAEVSRRRVRRRRLWIGSSVAAAVAIIAIVIGLVSFGTGGSEMPMVAEVTDTLPDDADFDAAVAEEDVNDATESGQAPSTGKDITVRKEPAPKNYAAETAKTNYANVLYPYKDVQYIATGRKSIDFRWDSDAERIRLSVTDVHNVLMVDEWIAGEEHYLWNLPVVKNNVFYWKMVFVFSDGSTMTKQGRIQDENLVIQSER